MHAHCCANGTLKKKPCLLDPEFPGLCKSLCWVLRLQRMPWYPGVPCQDCPDFYMVNKIVVQIQIQTAGQEGVLKTVSEPTLKPGCSTLCRDRKQPHSPPVRKEQTRKGELLAGQSTNMIGSHLK